MNIKTLIQRFQNAFISQPAMDDEVVIKFLKILETAHAEELSCSETYARLDEFVEAEVRKKDAARIKPLIRQHLDMCPDCCEEYEALLAVLENTKEK